MSWAVFGSGHIICKVSLSIWFNGILKSAFGTFRDWYVVSRQYYVCCWISMKETKVKKKRVWAVKEMKSQKRQIRNKKEFKKWEMLTQKNSFCCSDIEEDIVSVLKAV